MKIQDQKSARQDLHFPDTWKTYTLGEIYTERKEAGDPELPILTVSIHSGVSDGALAEEEIGKTVKRIADKAQYKTARAGDLVFNMMRAWQGAIGVARSDGLVSPAYIVATPNEELVYPLFMDYYMKSPKMVGIINRQSYGVTDFRKRMYWDSFAPIKCTLPSIAEQRKIVEILAKQDRVMELQQEKIDELVVLKKAYLSKMFPRKRARVPELRFNGFTCDWELRKLESLCDVFTDGDWIESKDQSESGVRLVQTGNVGITQYVDNENRKKWISEETFERLKCKEIFEGDILISRLPEPAGRSCIIPNLGTRMITAVDCTIVRTSKECDSRYLVQYLSSPSYFNDVNSFLGGGTRQRISRGNLSEINVPLPTNLVEQAKIGAVFANLDNTIVLHQSKLEQEKQKKKALMQLLLTGIVRV